MNVDGIYKIELLGPDGWEADGTAFLDGGLYRGASLSYYEQGVYQISGDTFTMQYTSNVYGSTHRALFGSKRRLRDLALEGKIEADTISGNVKDDGFSLTYRATRVGDLA